MPAIAEEIDAALEEGVILQELTLPLRIQHHDDGAELTCTRMTLGEADASGRRQAVPDTSIDAQVAFRCEKVILALGQSADVSILPEGENIRDDGQIIGVAGAPLFIGGDLGKNDGTVAGAIGGGRRAALHIHSTLSGVNLFENELPVATPDVVNTRTFTSSPAARGATIPRLLREHTFAEVHLGITDAAKEAARCFSCGVCNSCDRCVTHCPEGVLVTRGDTYTFDYDYCKGCGVCASECPRGVIVISEIQSGQRA
jgi:Pyruvate/2-oxoacid:ferredoxin oxidoreductase delta subunit